MQDVINDETVILFFALFQISKSCTFRQLMETSPDSKSSCVCNFRDFSNKRFSERLLRCHEEDTPFRFCSSHLAFSSGDEIGTSLPGRQRPPLLVLEFVDAAALIHVLGVKICWANFKRRKLR